MPPDVTAVPVLAEEFRIMKGTLTGFNDAVFSIAITLLVRLVRRHHARR